jgi:hypothetical protein
MKTFSEILEEIGEEKIAICHNDQPLTVTRLEAAARKLFLMAHGGVEEVRDETGQMIKVFHKGDPRFCKMIREYTEGRPNVEAPPKENGNRKPGAFDSSIGKRLSNKLSSKRPVKGKTKHG